MSERPNGGISRARPVMDKPVNREFPPPSEEALKTARVMTALTDYLHREGPGLSRHFYDKPGETMTREDAVKGACVTVSDGLEKRAAELGYNIAKIGEWEAFPYSDGRPNHHSLCIIKLADGYMSVDPTIAQVGPNPNAIAEFFEGTLPEVQRHLQDRYGGSWEELTTSNIDIAIENAKTSAGERKKERYFDHRLFDRLKQVAAAAENDQTQPFILQSHQQPYTKDQIAQRTTDSYLTHFFSVSEINVRSLTFMRTEFLTDLIKYGLVDEGIYRGSGNPNTRFIDYLDFTNIYGGVKLPTHIERIKDQLLAKAYDYIVSHVRELTPQQLSDFRRVIDRLVENDKLQRLYDEHGQMTLERAR